MMGKKKSTREKKGKGAAERFVEGLRKRGEVIDRTKKKEKPEDGESLPSGVTHEIIGYDESGKPIIRRRRFSSF